jgi:hypothetical protein
MRDFIKVTKGLSDPNRVKLICFIYPSTSLQLPIMADRKKSPKHSKYEIDFFSKTI